MWMSKKDEPDMAALAVLAASAREAEELLAEETGLDEDVIEEANRRLRLFMRMARQMSG